MATPLETTTAHDAERDFSVNGMNCASCVAHVTKVATAVPGVRAVNVNLARGKAHVVFDEAATSADAIASAVSNAGYPTKPEESGRDQRELEEERLHAHHEHARDWLKRFVIAAILWAPVELTHWIVLLTQGAHAHDGSRWIIWLSFATSTAALVLVGGGFYRSAWAALKQRTSNMDTLIALGASVAYLFSAVAFLGYLGGVWTTLPSLYFMESTGLLALVSLGHWLEARARALAGSAIRELMNLAPQTALRLNSPDDTSTSESVPVSQLSEDDYIFIRPGDRIATDGVVVDGRTTIEESMITGEPLPVTRSIGDTVIGGTLNVDGRLIVRVSKVGSETALAQIVKLVETAQSSKPPVQKLADKIAAIFVPSVLAIALLTAIGWLIAGQAFDWSTAETWGKLAKAVCSVLIIACPCALGLAVPAALMVGTGRGARQGILIRDIDGLQKAERIDTVVLDKTGTITLGKPIVANVQAVGAGIDEVLRLAASAEQFSEHPIAKSIVAAAREKQLAIGDVSEFVNRPGLGVEAEVDGVAVVVGSAEHVQSVMPGAIPTIPPTGKTSVYVALRDSAKLLGVITLDDALKPDSAEAIRALHAMGLRTVLLSGDNEHAARNIAKQVGIDDVRANVKPAQKAEVVRALQASGRRVAMVGDGINDAPALAAADLGVAIGSGSDVAKETGDIVLVSGSLVGVVTAIELSRSTMRTIRQNLFFAFIYNVLAIPLAAFGLLSPYIAAGAMALSDVTVIGNALLLRKKRLHRNP